MSLFESEKTMRNFLDSLPKSKQDELEKQWQSYIGMYGIDLARGKDMTVTLERNRDRLIEKIKRHEPITSDDARTAIKDLE